MKIVRGNLVPYVPASHEDPNQPGVLKRVLATDQDLQAGQVMMVNWARLPAGRSFQRHYHEDLQEVFVMTRGPAEMRVNGEMVELDSGDAIVIDPGEVHEMTNSSNDDVEYVVFGISSGKGGQTVVVDDE